MELRELKKTKKVVEMLLRNEPQTRNSDSYLYLKVIEVMASYPPAVLEMPISDFLVKYKELGYPPFESVRRARQKVQQEFPYLKACEEVEAARVENIPKYQSF